MAAVAEAAVVASRTSCALLLRDERPNRSTGQQTYRKQDIYSCFSGGKAYSYCLCSADVILARTFCRLLCLRMCNHTICYCRHWLRLVTLSFNDRPLWNRFVYVLLIGVCSEASIEARSERQSRAERDRSLVVDCNLFMPIPYEWSCINIDIGLLATAPAVLYSYSTYV